MNNILNVVDTNVSLLANIALKTTYLVLNALCCCARIQLTNHIKQEERLIFTLEIADVCPQVVCQHCFG